MTKQKNLPRGVADVTRVTKLLNDRAPGAGDQLSQVIGHLSNRLDAQAGHRGTVAIAKQTAKDATNKARAGLDLNGARLTGVAEPVEGKDVVTLDYWRRFESCDSFRQRVEDCVKFERKVRSSIGGQLFRPTGSILFVDKARDLVYYDRAMTSGGGTYPEEAGAVGVIDITNKHAPERIGYLVVNRSVGPYGFAVDPVRRIGFAHRVSRSPFTQSARWLWGSYDFNTPTAPTPIQITGELENPTPEADFTPPYPGDIFELGNKAPESNSLYSYYTNNIFQSGGGTGGIPFWQNSWYRLHVWNFSNPAGMHPVRTYDIGGYHVDQLGYMPVPSELGVQGLHFGFHTDYLGRGNRAWNISFGDVWFNFTSRSEMFLNYWDISDPGDVSLIGRRSLGYGLLLGGNFVVGQVRSILAWDGIGQNDPLQERRVFVLATTYEPTVYPDNPTGTTLFAFDYTNDVPVLKTKMRHACGSLNGMSIWNGTCFHLRIGSYDTLWDVSDMGNFQLLGGCQRFRGGRANYRPGYLYSLDAFGIPDQQEPHTKPGFGFTIQYFGESGINCE